MEQLILRRWNYDDVIENYHWHARQQQPRRHPSIFREFRYVFRLIGGGGMVLLQNGHVYAKPIDSLSVINQSEGFSDDAL